VTTTPQEPDPDSRDEPILDDRDEAEVIKADTTSAGADPAEQDDRA
jgi:hypothetical protein